MVMRRPAARPTADALSLSVPAPPQQALTEPLNVGGAVVTAALGQHLGTIQFASDGLRADTEVMTTAVGLDGSSICQALEGLKMMPRSCKPPSDKHGGPFSLLGNG